MRVFYTASNGGDGSYSVGFYESQECIDKLEEFDPEGYGSGEGGSWFDVPDGTVFSGITIDTMADVDEYLEDMGLLEEEDE